MAINRVSTANSYDRTLHNIGQRSSELSKSQEHISSRKRVLRASDDAVAATLAERARSRQLRNESDLRALEASRTALTQVESALGDGIELTKQARELIVQAGNSTLSATDRGILANQIDGLRDQLLEVANRKDTSGLTLFGGLGGGSKPFDHKAGIAPDEEINFYGQNGQYLPTENALPKAVDGSVAWRVGSPNTALTAVKADGEVAYIFDVLEETAKALRDPAKDLATTVGNGLADVDQALENMRMVRGQAGQWLNRADSMENLFQDRDLFHEKEISDLTDLDLAKGYSEFQTQQLALNAALQSYAQVQKKSLFQYMA
jgi:flagellar hook-associated protein 3 FlgL